MIRLPVTGDPIHYPFDQYRLHLVLYATTVAADGTETAAEPMAGAGLLNFSVENRTPRVKLGAPQELQSLSENHQFIQFNDTLTLSRPLYLQVLASLLVMLVAAASAYAVFMRPLDQLIINAGALVLGVWGIRAILLGSGLTVVTLVDLSLTGVILFLLVGITVRTLQRLEARTGVYVLHPRTWSKTGAGATGDPQHELETAEKALPEAAESARPDNVERRDSEARPQQP